MFKPNQKNEVRRLFDRYRDESDLITAESLFANVRKLATVVEPDYSDMSALRKLAGDILRSELKNNRARRNEQKIQRAMELITENTEKGMVFTKMEMISYLFHGFGFTSTDDGDYPYAATVRALERLAETGYLRKVRIVRGSGYNANYYEGYEVI
jgi:hypothetical protein